MFIPSFPLVIQFRGNTVRIYLKLQEIFISLNNALGNQNGGNNTVSAESYIKSTEPAVQLIFMGLQLYRYLTPRPALEQYREEDGGIKMTHGQAQGFLKDEVDAMSLDTAKATLSGAIIQVACSGLNQHSTEIKIPKELNITMDQTKAKFCVGRTVHGLPLGLVVYAARIQYNH
ncbi:hypothetical protein [Methylophaga sp. OBS4]|uniref:hypothetical protein n=1 Tax=Methylophaga sp. OBS4 TaxID=2991935 RepID=UPI00224E25A1|nr:hypothetical protein [Methylophaga sp. OBS4]MCX4187118.1 hypothetical protein [Methylophaga sp. OBS4]